jgi:hypothetical protein
MRDAAYFLGLVGFVPMLSRHFVQNRGIAVAIVQSANGFARGFSAVAFWLLREPAVIRQ